MCAEMKSFMNYVSQQEPCIIPSQEYGVQQLNINLTKM